MIKFVGILFFVLTVKRSECANYGNLMIDDIRNNFLVLEDTVWNFVLQQHKDNYVDPGVEIIKEFHHFDKKVRQMPQDILYGMKIPKKTEQFLTLYSDVRIIHDLYDKFTRYQEEYLSPVKKDYSEYKREITTSNIIDDILYDVKNNVNQTTLRIFNQTNGLVYDTLNIVIENEYTCKYPDQPSRLVYYNIYNMIAQTELKGYILTQFAYMALRLQEKGNYTEASKLARQEFKDRVFSEIMLFDDIMDIASNEMYRCDPKIHMEGHTYEQITKLLQAHIQNEVDLNDRGTCTETCSTYSITRSYGCYDAASDYCRHVNACKGTIYNCQFIESDLKTCVAPLGSNRRYEYIEYDGGKVYGEKTRCTQRTVNSWYRWFVHCSYCLCYCDEQGSKSDRYFNLRPTTADVDNNRVITGIRLVKRNRVFHIQIQEGMLLPYGYIDQNTVTWVPVDDYRITDFGVTNGEDYHTLDYNHRSIYLDNLYVENQHHLITGAKFVLDRKNLQFQIRVTPFNFTTGTLYNDDSYQVWNDASIRSSISLNHPDIPTNSPSSTENFRPNLFIDFTHTDLYKDAAQTTVPFIDIQSVNAEPAVPLQSAGIYYKGNPGYGGFIGVRAAIYNYNQHMTSELPDDNDRIDSEEIFGVLPN